MATIGFQCYGCQKTFQVPEANAGKRAKCNNCGTIVTIPLPSAQSEAVSEKPIAPPPLPPSPPKPKAVDPVRANYVPDVDDDDEVFEADVADTAVTANAPSNSSAAEPMFDDDFDRPRRSRERMDRPRNEGGGEKLASIGLLVSFIGWCILSFAVLLSTIGYLLQTIQWIQMLSGSMPTDMGRTPHLLLGVGAIISVLGSITAIVGYVLGMLGPKKHGILGFSIAAVAVTALYMILTLIFEIPFYFDSQAMFRMMMNNSFTLMWIMFVFALLLWTAQAILYPLALRGFNLLNKRRGETGPAITLVIMGAIYGALRFINLILWYSGTSSRSASLTSARALGWINLIMLWIGTVVLIIYLVIYLRYNWRTRDMVTR